MEITHPTPPYLDAQVPPGLRPRLQDLAIRLRDIFGSLAGLILLSPLLAGLALWIRRDSPGPALFRGERVGRGGRVFRILKFRTMHECPESYAGPRITADNDERITPLGRWLRATKLNELPQLWNVLVGDMSLVGPRPEDPAVVALWPEVARREILAVRPGITSPASVAYHDEEQRLNGDSLMQEYLHTIVPDKLRLDQLYVRHRTFLTDLDALFWTLTILVPTVRAARIPEGWLFGGPLSRLARRYWNWILVDFIIALASILLWGIVWRFAGPLDLGVSRALGMGIILALLFSLGNTLFGLKGVAWSRAQPEDSLRLLFSCFMVGFLGILLHRRTDAFGAHVPVEMLVAISSTVSLGVVAVRYRSRLLTGLASRWVTWRGHVTAVGERVLVIGAGYGSEYATWMLRRGDFRQRYTIIGLVDDDPAKQGVRLDGLPVLGTCADIPALVARHDIGVLFYTIQNIAPASAERILTQCRATSARLINLEPILNTLRDHLAPAAETAQ